MIYLYGKGNLCLCYVNLYKRICIRLRLRTWRTLYLCMTRDVRLDFRDVNPVDFCDKAVTDIYVVPFNRGNIPGVVEKQIQCHRPPKPYSCRSRALFKVQRSDDLKSLPIYRTIVAERMAIAAMVERVLYEGSPLGHHE